MALESLPKIAPALFSAEQDLIQIYNKKTDTTGVINASLLGGSTPPSGVSGAIQFSNGSAFASDASNLFWDDTNNRLGVGTNTPNSLLNVIGTGGVSGIRVNTSGADSWMPFSDGNWYVRSNGVIINDNNTAGVSIGTNSPTTARLMVKGSGSTSATTSLLVQNSAGNSALQVTDDQMVRGYNATGLRFRLGTTSGGQGISTREGEFAVGFIDSGQSPALRFLVIGSGASYIDGYTEGTAKTQNYPLFIGSRVNNTGTGTTGSTTQENGMQTVFGSAVNEASSLVTINSTTRGFLPPRMTTTQKNAIASPAAGLVVYDSTTNKLCCYNGSTWNDLF